MGKVDTSMNEQQKAIRGANAQSLMEAYQAKAQGVTPVHFSNSAVLGGADRAPVGPAATLSDVVESLDVSITNLQERLNFLAERLTPVLRQTTSAGVSPGPQEHNAIILNIFEQQTFRIRQLLNQTHDLVERLVL